VRQWLSLDAVEERGRVPFNTHVPFARWLLDRDAPPPKEGEKAKGPKGEFAWRAVEAKEDGSVSVEGGAWFFGTVETPAGTAERVYLAHLAGASTLFVNGAGFVGDVYGYGTGPVPVALRPGPNRVFVTGRRGPWSLRFEPWNEGRCPVLDEDATLPEFTEESVDSVEGAVRIVRPTLAWTPEPRLEIGSREGPQDPASPPEGGTRMPTAPLWTGKVPIEVAPIENRGGGGGRRLRRIRIEEAPEPGSRKKAKDSTSFRLETKPAGGARRVTFRSNIDGSVQWYGILDPAKSEKPPERIGTVLSLHGAGADALRQAGAYSPKPDFRIVAPTNRRPFGFDWQDWGRLDAYEALSDAQKRYGGENDAVFLTGHSMGGHGVWHLAANDPDRWAAIAPSAGWCSFDTYGGAGRPSGPLTPIWRGCDGGSRTEDLVANLAPIPTLILHGAKDPSVPLSEAEGMLARLEKAGGKPLHHFQEGAEHWWDGEASPGVDCVDWPGIFDLFRKSPSRSRGPRAAGAPAPASPAAGPFKRVFDNRFVLVVGTKGTEAENRELLELARWHATTWWYRADGCAPLVRDSDLLADPETYAGRNLVLYGNADVNAAWTGCFGEDGPLRVRRGEIRLGDRTWKGDSLGALFVRPRTSALGFPLLVGAFASTGPRGTRIAYGLVPFTSGVGYPDYAVFGEEVLLSGDGGVLAAGFFDREWRLPSGGFVRAEEGK
jgi:dienelactone hydrolase